MRIIEKKTTIENYWRINLNGSVHFTLKKKMNVFEIVHMCGEREKS